MALILLLPFGMWADRTDRIKKIPVITLAAMGFGYVVLFFVPSAGTRCMPLLFFALTFTMAGTTLYNAQWQNFFGEVITPDSRPCFGHFP